MNKQPPSTQLTLTRKSIGIKSLSLGLKFSAISHWLQNTDRLFPILELTRLVSTMGIVVKFSRSLLELNNTWTGSHLTLLLQLDPWPLVVNDSCNSQLSITVTNAWEVERRKDVFVLAEVSVTKWLVHWLPDPCWSSASWQKAHGVLTSQWLGSKATNMIGMEPQLPSITAWLNNLNPF